MKALLVAEKDSTRISLLHHLTPRGFDLIHYRHPIKAMDNIDEIGPEVVFFSAEDFPRHWKPFVTFLRGSLPKGKTTFVLLKGEIFSPDEAAKAKHLEVACIIQENLENRKEWGRLEKLLSRYAPHIEGRSEARYFPEEHDDIEFIFTHPQNYSVITGTISALSPNGTAFTPDDLSLVSSIAANTRIRHCSLRIDADFISFQAKVMRNADQMGLNFLDLDERQKTTIAKFIERRVDRSTGNAPVANAAPA